MDTRVEERRPWPRPVNDADFIRRPGLYRAWEVAHLLMPDAVFLVEAAGQLDDGCDLFFVSELPQSRSPEA